uniref:ATP synthase subunit b, chloroplastic n=1 Tax=Passiflora filipes TaxID=298520 RepID=A0A4Y5QFV8_9ROSI|nr:ATP synthase CF0 subunit I [Passiflora filipes]QCX30520.1 ATP synthase CF0 subunit I [Passiflora filipes]
MKNLTNSFVFLVHWPSAGSFGLNTDILATNIINLSVVLGVLIFFGKGLLSDLLAKRKQRILNTIRNSEELCAGARERLEKAQARLGKVEIDADLYRVSEYSEIEQQGLGLFFFIFKDLEKFEKSKNETILVEQEKVINEVKEEVCKQLLQRVRATLNSYLTNELHLRTISANIEILEEM